MLLCNGVSHSLGGKKWDLFVLSLWEWQTSLQQSCGIVCQIFKCYWHWNIRIRCFKPQRDRIMDCLRRVSEIDLSQPRHETAFWWRHNGPVTSQLTTPIKWPNYPLELIGMYVHINTYNKESQTQRCRRSTNVQLCLIVLYIFIWFESKWNALFCITNKRRDVIITMHAIMRHLYGWRRWDNLRNVDVPVS